MISRQNTPSGRLEKINSRFTVITLIEYLIQRFYTAHEKEVDIPKFSWITYMNILNNFLIDLNNSFTKNCFASLVSPDFIFFFFLIFQNSPHLLYQLVRLFQNNDYVAHKAN